MNRFSQDKIRRRFSLNSLSVILFILLFVLFFIGVSNVGETSLNKQQEGLESALGRCIIQCYALEGKYPDSLEYMEEHYGLSYNKDLFFVDYAPYASNIDPEVTMIRRQVEE